LSGHLSHCKKGNFPPRPVILSGQNMQVWVPLEIAFRGKVHETQRMITSGSDAPGLQGIYTSTSRLGDLFSPDRPGVELRGFQASGPSHNNRTSGGSRSWHWSLVILEFRYLCTRLCSVHFRGEPRQSNTGIDRLGLKTMEWVISLGNMCHFRNSRPRSGQPFPLFQRTVPR
jgi:hypothetical protein